MVTININRIEIKGYYAPNTVCQIATANLSNHFAKGLFKTEVGGKDSVSNSFAIATVTATLRDVLQGEINSDISGVEVTMRSPGIIQNPKDILNLFLYQVTPNNGYSNLDLPSRSYNGDLAKKTILGLDLDYLLTAFSETDDLKAHRIIAIAMRTLHENPVLTREVYTSQHNWLARGRI